MHVLVYFVYLFKRIYDDLVLVGPISKLPVKHAPFTTYHRAITNRQQTVGKQQIPRCSHVSVDKGKIQAAGAPTGPLRALLTSSIQRLSRRWRHGKRCRWRRDIWAWPAEQCHRRHRARVECWRRTIRWQYGGYIPHAFTTDFATHDITTSAGG